MKELRPECEGQNEAWLSDLTEAFVPAKLERAGASPATHNDVGRHLDEL